MRRMRHLKPREIQGCQLALDASIPGSLYDATSGGSLVAADGQVARWEDQSGNGRHVTQSTSARRPLRRVANRAGLDVLQSSADTASSLQTASFYPSSGAGDVTIVSVSIPLSGSTFSCAWVYGGTTGGRAPGYFPKYSTSNSCVDFNSTYIGRSGSPTEISNWHAHSYTASGATTTADTSQRVNSSAVSENYTINPTTALNAGATYPFRVGANVTPSLRIGFMAFYATYGAALSGYVLLRLESSAMRKWRISG